MGETAGVRKLDLAAKASINIVDLNNKVVLMRKVVRRARLYVIHALTRKVKMLRKKKGSEEQKQKNEMRAKKLVDEIKVIQVLKPDYVSKYALGSTDRLQDLVCKPTTTIEMRALARLAENKILQQVVKEFREQHSDWQQLAAFLMTKHTSREFKKKKTKTKLAKVKVNVEATETIVKSYLNNKLGASKDKVVEIPNMKPGGDLDGYESSDGEHSDTEEKDTVRDDDDDSDEWEKDSDGKYQENYSDENDKTGIESVVPKEKEESSESDDSESDMAADEKLADRIAESSDEDEMNEECNLVEGMREEENDESNSVEGSDEDSEEDHSGNSNEEEEQESEDNSSSDPDSVSKQIRIGILKKSDKSDRNIKSDFFQTKGKKGGGKKFTHPEQSSLSASIAEKRKSADVEKKCDEMIVKRLKLTESAESITEEIEKTEMPKFLLGVLSSEKPEKCKKRRKKDPFFDSGVEVEEDSDTETKYDKKKTKDLDRASKFDHMSDKVQGLKALSTTFLGSLNSGKMMECSDPAYRTNAEWKSMREDKISDRNFRGRGDFRGRGRSDFRGRGRGQFRGRGNGDSAGRGGLSDRGRGNFREQGKGDFQGRGRGESRGGGRGDRGSQGRGAGGGQKPGNTGRQQKPLEQAGPLHPSWAASQKRKQQAASIHTFHGKKTTFDD